jgi:hypothetical protein
MGKVPGIEVKIRTLTDEEKDAACEICGSIGEKALFNGLAQVIICPDLECHAKGQERIQVNILGAGRRPLSYQA